MPEDEEKDVKEFEACVNGLCENSKSRSASVRGAVRGVLGTISPLLVRSPDPRVKALGLAMGVISRVIYKKR